ncbi:MAG: hypothetical protein WCT50_01225 [Patescibacteria group bacterium]
MNIGTELKNLIPNPLSKRESLAGLTKKIELIAEGLTFISIAKQIFALVIGAFILYFVFNISISFVAILFSAGLLMMLANLFFSSSKLKSIKLINAQEDPLSSWKILVISERYNTLAAGVATIESILGVYLFIFILNGGFIKLDISPNVIPYIKYFLFFVIFAKLWGFAMSLIKYNIVLKIPKSSDIAELDKNYSLVNVKFSILRISLVIAVMALCIPCLLFFKVVSIEIIFAFRFLLVFFIPIFICLFAFLILDILSHKKLKNLNLNSRTDSQTSGQAKSLEDKQPHQENLVKISEYQDEKILGSVFGITKGVASFKDMFSRTTGSSEFLGVGQNFAPENTLLITNYRLLFIQVPMTGGDKVITGTDYTMNNIMFNRSEIAKNGEELLKNNSISQISPLIRNEVLYKDVMDLILNKFIIKIKKINGEKFRYAFFDKEYADLINKILPAYLKDKFTSK